MIKFPEKNLIYRFHCSPLASPAARRDASPLGLGAEVKRQEWMRQIMEWSVAPLRGDDRHDASLMSCTGPAFAIMHRRLWNGPYGPSSSGLSGLHIEVSVKPDNLALWAEARGGFRLCSGPSKLVACIPSQPRSNGAASVPEREDGNMGLSGVRVGECRIPPRRVRRGAGRDQIT
jgi:hypothetical protein